ncbi:hypothetical protein [Spirosoma jeollabukense]
MRTLQLIFIYLTVALIFMLCRRADTTILEPESTPNLTSDSTDYKVYSAIIDQYCPTQQAARQVIIVAPQTGKPYLYDWQNVLKEAKQDSITTNPVWQQFVSTVDSSQFKIKSLNGSVVSVCYRTQLLTDQQWTYYFNTPSSPGIEGLRKDVPDFSSLVSFSSVVYSDDGNKAVCYRSSVCGGLCGTGEIYFLEKKATGWRVASNRLLWIS